jgi:endonuclease/exonuclease/phosphatase family metal-dependent hydrolase
MPVLRLATFNVENLLMRCDFRAGKIDGLRQKLTGISEQAHAEAVSRVFNVLSEDDRTLTAQALAATRADICALQEVENLVTLTTFHDKYLSRWSAQPYGQHILFEGNDQRGIDVGVLSRVEIAAKQSHAGLRFADLGITPPAKAHRNDHVFRRDCLELDVTKDGQRLTLFVCHFKSMHGGREETRGVRQAEALAVRKLIEARFVDPAAAKWAILGDLNDYLEIDGVEDLTHGLGPLIADGFAVDLAMACIADPLERWSHHYTPLSQYTALDHILVSPALAAENVETDVKYIRAGTPWRSQRHKGYRLQGVGWSNPKASDHCPLVASLRF